MYLHVGNNKIIREKNIIGIFDMDNASISKETRSYLADGQKEGVIESVTDDVPKSFIIYKDRESEFAGSGKFKICLSQLSSTALIGRISSEK